MVETLTEKDRKKSKWYAWSATIIYLFLFPFSLLFAGSSVLIFDSSRISVPVGLSVVFLYLCIPVSMLYTLCLVWSRYFKKEYKLVGKFCLIPLYVLAVTFIFETFVNIVTS